MKEYHYDATWWFISNINYIYALLLLGALVFYLWRKSKLRFRVAFWKDPDNKTVYRAEYRKGLFGEWKHEHMGVTSYEVDTKLAAENIIKVWKHLEKEGRSMRWEKGSNTSYNYYS